MKNLCLLILCCFFFAPVYGLETLNVYNWSDYLPDTLIKQFEKETGIRVYYSTYDSNETLYAKLKTNPRAGYDVIVPSTYYIDRMRHEDMLLKIDKKQLPNFKYLSPALLHHAHDPKNDYSIPYFWGTTAIAINTHFHNKKNLPHWQDLWKPEYKDTLMILDDMREVFSMALITLGYSANDTNEAHVYQAYLKLKTLLPNVRLFNSDAQEAIYIDEDATLGMGWSGGIYLAQKENPDIDYIYPQEGFVIWIDSLAIPKGAQHVQNAYRFINFILRPEIAKEISLHTGYASPNLGALKLLPPAFRDNPIVYPSESVLKRGQVQTDVGNTARTYEKYWELLKIAG